MSRITEEEMAILDGRTAIDRELYMHGQSNTVNAKNSFLLESSLRCDRIPGLSIFRNIPMTMWK